MALTVMPAAKPLTAGQEVTGANVADTLFGSAGRDIMSGRANHDRFESYLNIGSATGSDCDVEVDFLQKEKSIDRR